MDIETGKGTMINSNHGGASPTLLITIVLLYDQIIRMSLPLRSCGLGMSTGTARIQAVGVWLVQVDAAGDGIFLALEKGQALVGGFLQLLRFFVSDGTIGPPGFDGLVQQVEE